MSIEGTAVGLLEETAAAELLSEYGKPFAVAKAFLRGQIPKDKEDSVFKLVGPTTLQAARFNLKERGLLPDKKKKGVTARA